jgi:hypothetical protein
MPYGEVDHGKRFFSSRGCAETSIDGRPCTWGAALTRFGAQRKSSKRFDTMCAETAEASRTLQNNGRQGIVFRATPSHLAFTCLLVTRTFVRVKGLVICALFPLELPTAKMSSPASHISKNFSKL